MTWGEQNSDAEAFEQLDYAIDQGVNFIDTAEMYAIDTRAETYGRNEEIIGNWMATRGTRGKVVVDTKIVGPTLSASLISVAARRAPTASTSRRRSRRACNCRRRTSTTSIDPTCRHASA